MSEWFKEHAWKVCIRQKCIQGSNPCLSASPAEGGFYAQPKKKKPPSSAFSGLRRVKERWQSWFNAPDSKSDVLSKVPGVRIPLSPQTATPCESADLQGVLLSSKLVTLDLSPLLLAAPTIAFSTLILPLFFFKPDAETIDFQPDVHVRAAQFFFRKKTV